MVEIDSYILCEMKGDINILPILSIYGVVNSWTLNCWSLFISALVIFQFSGKWYLINIFLKNQFEKMSSEILNTQNVG